MSRPGVEIFLTNGGLGIQPASDFGVSAVLIASPVAPVAGYGTAFMVKTKTQVATAFAQVGNEDVVKAINEGFYAAAPEGTKLYVLCMAAATTLTTLGAAANANKVLSLGAGTVRLLAAIKFPDEEYEPTVTDGFDQDVHTAVTALQTLSATWFDDNKPFRYFVEGFAFADPATAKNYATSLNRNGFIVAANIDGSTARATMLAMGAAAAVEPQRNIGRIKNGSLPIPETSNVKIGAIAVDAISGADLDTLFEKRYISIEKNKSASGYVFTYDCALCDPTDDYNNLRFGRVIDNATRIAFVTYYRELKDDVEVFAGGRLSTVAEKALEIGIEQAIDDGMRNQLSKKTDGSAAVECLINPDPAQYALLYEQADIEQPNFNLLQTGTIYVFIRLLPKGSLDYINLYLGYSPTVE
ncbi:hypothetical protein F0L74_05925 [Chitinophaga agrisoli]|uniref:Tail sheath protein subtilisin-like domain-containing protein n=1 Tax=Chitinophaga agrisoli TaxID=2607653 RepID=A0A5B2W308_9BACT|nr:DUF2586 family protein [Chitinophaga agrisoli]KAA2245494.1 hypothetical protein F0L74_05925 [Chitinophaga agrisoli]